MSFLAKLHRPGAAFALVLAVALLSALAPTVLAEAPTQEPPVEESTAEETSETATPSLETALSAHSNALRVVLDPETGRLRPPTSEELDRFLDDHVGQRALRDRDLEVREGVAGTVVLHLDQRFERAALAVVDADGAVTVQHDAVLVPVAESATEETKTVKEETP